MLIQTFELARSASRYATVHLCFINGSLRQPQWAFDMLDEAAKDRLSVSYRPMPDNAPAAPKGPTPSILALLLPVIKELRLVPRELLLIKSFKPDVIVVRPDHAFSFVISSKLSGVPLVLSTDGPVEELAEVWGSTMKWPVSVDLWRARRAAAITCISESCKSLWLGKKIEERRLFLCPNGVDPDVFAPRQLKDRRKMRAKFGLSDKDIVIGFAGNQRFWHGLHLLVKAFIGIAAADARLRLFVAGTLENPETIGLDEIPENMRSRINFTGPVQYDSMPDILDCIDLFVMPYPRQGLFHFSPMKMFEALSMGKIVVASNQGQIGEMLLGLASAFLYNPDEKQGLTAALENAVTVFNASPNLGTNSREFAIRNHTWLSRGKTLVTACQFAVEEFRKESRQTKAGNAGE